MTINRTPKDDPFNSIVNGLVDEFRFRGRRTAFLQSETEASTLVDALQMVCIHALPSPRHFPPGIASDYRWRVDRF